MLTVLKSEMEILNNFKLLQDLQKYNGWFTTDLQARLQTSDSDPRTGTFLQNVAYSG